MARAPGTGRAGSGATSGAGTLVHGRPASAGTPDRRDRRAGGRHPAVGTAATAHRLRRPPAAFSPQHRILCGLRDVQRLPHPVVSGESAGARRQRVQHQVGVVAPRRLQRAGDARPDRAAHGADRTGVYRRCAAVDLGAHRRPAVAGERALLRRLFPPQAGARPCAPRSPRPPSWTRRSG